MYTGRANEETFAKEARPTPRGPRPEAHAQRPTPEAQAHRAHTGTHRKAQCRAMQLTPARRRAVPPPPTPAVCVCVQVAFLHDDAYVATGGDCGRLFVWGSESARLVYRAKGDGSIVNCVAPHPTLPLIAVSGSNAQTRGPLQTRDATHTPHLSLIHI